MALDREQFIENVTCLAVKRPWTDKVWEKELIEQGHPVNEAEVKAALQEIALPTFEHRLSLIWEVELVVERIIMDQPGLSLLDLAEASAAQLNLRQTADIHVTPKVVRAFLEARELAGMPDRELLVRLYNGELREVWSTAGVSHERVLERFVHMAARGLSTARRTTVDRLKENIRNLAAAHGLVVGSFDDVMEAVLMATYFVKEEVLQRYYEQVRSDRLVFKPALVALAAAVPGLFPKSYRRGRLQDQDRGEARAVRPGAAADNPVEDDQTVTLDGEQAEQLRKLFQQLESLRLQLGVGAPSSEGKRGQEPSLHDAASAEVADLREENLRLQQQLEVERTRGRQAAQRQLNDLLKALVDERVGYPLTRLWLMVDSMQADTDAILGNLLNLFNILHDEGLSPFSGGRKMGEVFSLDLDDVGRRYIFAQSIGPRHGMPVRLIASGWTFRGEPIKPAIIAPAE